VSSIVLLGSHGEGVQGKGAPAGSSKLPDSVLEGLARDIKEAMAGSRQAGHCENLSSMLMDVLKTHLSLKKRMLRDYTTKSKVGGGGGKAGGVSLQIRDDQ